MCVGGGQGKVPKKLIYRVYMDHRFEDNGERNYLKFAVYEKKGLRSFLSHQTLNAFKYWRYDLTRCNELPYLFALSVIQKVEFSSIKRAYRRMKCCPFLLPQISSPHKEEETEVKNDSCHLEIDCSKQFQWMSLYANSLLVSAEKADSCSGFAFWPFFRSQRSFPSWLQVNIISSCRK